MAFLFPAWNMNPSTWDMCLPQLGVVTEKQTVPPLGGPGEVAGRSPQPKAPSEVATVQSASFPFLCDLENGTSRPTPQHFGMNSE